MYKLFFYCKIYWLFGLFIVLLYPCKISGQNEKADKPDVRGSCGGSFTGRSGVIASPGFPEKGPVGTNCTYEIEVAPGFVVAYQSTFINLEKGCYDYLLIFPRKDVSEENGVQYCDSNAVPLETTQENKLTVTFHSDEVTPSEGFVISWYALNVSDLPPTFNCSFDGPIALCPGWTQVENDFDQMNFQFRRDSTPSDNTGPSQDSNGSGRYAYIEASKKAEGDTAVLISPEIVLNEHEEYCLSMMYHNNGSKHGSLELIRIVDGGDGYLIYSAKNATDKWLNINATMYRSEEAIRVGIRAIRGGNWQSDVAIDDIKLLPYPCVIDDYDYSQNNYSEYDNTTDYYDYGCSESDFLCSDIPGDCISDSKVCEGTQDCDNGSDEDPEMCAERAATFTETDTTVGLEITTRTELTTTMKPTESVVEKTTDSSVLTTCQLQYEAYLQIKRGDPNSPIGPSLPDCASDGKFIKKQCDYEFCYCVDPETGDEVVGSRQYKNLFIGDCTEDLTPTTVSSTTEGAVEETTEFYDYVTTAEEEIDPDVHEETTADAESTTILEETTSVTKTSTTTESATTAAVLTTCQLQYEAYLRIKRGDPNSSIGPSLPDCASDGKFIKKQCDYEFCYCVDPETGDEVVGSRQYKNLFIGDCTEDLTPTTVSSTTEGAVLVKETTESIHDYDTTAEAEIDLTTAVASPFTPQSTTPANALTSCQQQRQNYSVSKNSSSSFPTESYLPDCTPEGLYAPSQCDEVTGYCFCVNEKTGLIIRGTRRLKDAFVLDCLALTSCQMSFHNISLFRERNPNIPNGPFPPVCTSEGLFARRQCDIFTLVCRCVEPVSGAVIPGTETEPFKGFDLACKEPAATEVPAVPISPPAGGPTCMLIYNAVTKFTRENPEAETPHVPVCKEDGSFRPLQCNSTSKACWCVDEKSGNFIDGSATAPGQGHLLNCSDPQPQSCGGTFTNLTGVIKSPNFPNSYTSLAGCVYRIERSDKTQFVMIRMNYLNLAPKDVDGFCQSDRLGFGNFEQLHYSACGTFVDDSSVYFDTDVIMTLVPGDYEHPKKGFSLSYEIKKCPVSGQLFSKTASSCDRTCSNMDPVCVKDFAERCSCPFEKPILFNNTCVTAKECPKLNKENEIPKTILAQTKIEDVTIASSSSNAVCLSIAASLTATVIHALLYLASEQNGKPVAKGNANRIEDDITLCFEDLMSGTEYVTLLWSIENGTEESAFPFSFKTMDVGALSLTSSMSFTAPAESTKKSTQPIDVTTASVQPDEVTEVPMTIQTSSGIRPHATTVTMNVLESESTKSPQKLEEMSESDEFSVLEVDSTTVCAKIPHQMDQSIDSYMVTLDETQMTSSEGVSDQFQNGPAASPFTFVCFYDLQPSKDYSISVHAKQGTSFIGEKKSKSFKQKQDETEVGTTPLSMVYPQTEETKQWQKSYNDWRINTLNTWYTTLSSYLKTTGSQFPDLAPDHSKCPPAHRPRCQVQPKAITDYNGCLFFICESPTEEGDLTQSDVDAWKMEYNIFKDYLMPQWQELFAAYSEAQKQT